MVYDHDEYRPVERLEEARKIAEEMERITVALARDERTIRNMQDRLSFGLELIARVLAFKATKAEINAQRLAYNAMMRIRRNAS
jgi:hypothetical protein